MITRAALARPRDLSPNVVLALVAASLGLFRGELHLNDFPAALHFQSSFVCLQGRRGLSTKQRSRFAGLFTSPARERRTRTPACLLGKSSPQSSVFLPYVTGS